MELKLQDLDNIPEKWFVLITHYLQGVSNDSYDFRRPHLRESVAAVYPFFVFIYSMLVIVGTVANLAVIFTVLRHQLQRDPTYGYILNLAITDILKCTVVLPISLTILLVQNWVFGSFLCYFLPMLQDVPLHVTMLSFLLIAVDRYRFLLDPNKPRLPSFVCSVGTWLLAICIVLPYPIYLTYLDLGTYLREHFDGVGICVVNLVDDMTEYMRGLFIIMYVLPLAVMSYLYVKASRELKRQEAPMGMMVFQARNIHGQPNVTCHHSDRSENFDLYEAELDITKEKRNQKYLISMVTMFAICMCPLMVLRVVKLALSETYENSGHFDITYTMFVWIAFLPTCTTPYIFASWRMSRMAKERLRSYFRFSNCNFGQNRERQNKQISTEAACHTNKVLGGVLFSSGGPSSGTLAEFQPDLSSS